MNAIAMDGAVASLQVPAAHPVFAGHFPGRPLLPGVLLLAHVLEAVRADAARAARIGEAPRLASAKFLAPVRPGERFDIRLGDAPGGAVLFEVRCGERIAASGRFDAAPAAAAGESA